MEQLKKKVLEDYKKLETCTDSDIEDIAQKHKVTYNLVMDIIARDRYKGYKCEHCEDVVNRMYYSMNYPCKECTHAVMLKDHFRKARTTVLTPPNKPENGKEVEIMGELLKIDLNSQIERDKVMEKYGNVTNMYFGSNTDGEDMTISISNDVLSLYTFQSNGWVRENVYYYQDDMADEIFIGKWK